MKFTMLFAMLFCPIMLMAQKVKTVAGEYTYAAPQNVTLREAKDYALQRAKIKALADEFGTTVSMTNSSFAKETSSESIDKFVQVAEYEVNGEWIETVGKPDITVIPQDDGFLITAKVKGKAREIKRAKVEFMAKVLCNGTDDKFETDRFNTNDQLYLSFQSPTDGYCLVYLIDESQKAYCLLPYRQQTTGNFPVKANRRYVFFSPKDADRSIASLVDEYILNSQESKEYNQLYIIFSPNPLTKTIDRSTTELMPRETTVENFRKWLARCRRNDLDMAVEVKNIVIKGQP